QLSLAELYFAEQKFKQSLPHAKRVLALNPQRIESYRLVADIYDGLGRISEMVEPLETALELDPRDAEARLNLAYAYVWSGREEEARTYQRELSKRANQRISRGS